MVEQEKSQRRLEAALEYIKTEQGNSEVEQAQTHDPAIVANQTYQAPPSMPPAHPALLHNAEQDYGADYSNSVDEDDEIPAFLNEQRYHPEVPGGRSVTGVLIAISSLAAFTVFGAIVLYKSQLLDLSFLDADIVDGPISEARATTRSDSGAYRSANAQISNREAANNGTVAQRQDGGSVGNTSVTSDSGAKKAWQDKLVPQQNENSSPVIVSTSESTNSNLGKPDKYSAGVSTFGSVANAPSVETISTKVEDLPIDEVPIEGADVAINQLENSIVSSASVSQKLDNQSADAIVLAQVSSAKENIDPKLKALTDQVVEALSDLGGNGGNAAVPLADSVNRLRSSLANLVQEAELQGQSQENVELLIKEAIGGSSQNLPAALKNRDGGLDISSLLTSVVNRAKKVSSGSSADSAYLSAIEQEGDGTAITTDKVAARYVIVKSGDSLSSISFAAYGDALEYPKIYQANRNVISNPNILLIGTELLIP